MPYYDDEHMEDRNDYYTQLVNALENKAESLEHTTIRTLKGNLQGFEASVSAIYKFLIDKGIMQSDPYKHERSVTEIQVPSSAPFTDSDIQQEFSRRFSQYVSQWEFLVNLFHVGLSNLSLKKVHQFIDLLDYIRWNDFSVNSSYQITRTMAGIVGRVSQMNDPMTGKIISGSVSHLRELTKNVKSELKIITVFLRERYKVQVREKLTNGMNIDVEQYRRKPDSILDNVKFEFSHRMKGTGWYKELIYELLEEDYGIASGKLRENALERLKESQTAVKKKKRTEQDDTAVLLRILERMARAGEPIRSSLVKMNENTRTIRDRKRSLGERLSKIFSSLFKKSDGGIVYEVAIKDRVTGAVRLEALNYTQFSTVTIKRARALQEFLDPTSDTRKNVRSAGAAQLPDYINRNLNELKSIHRRLTGLDEYFQSNAVPQKIKSGMKGSSLNLKSLKLVIADSMKMLNEFKVKKEEEEQLRKLGIED